MRITVKLQNLFEGREEHVAQQFGAQVEAAYKKDSGRKPRAATSLDIVKYIAQASPRDVQWLVKMYVKGQYKLEDIEQIKQDLVKFNTIRTRLPTNQHDLGRYSDLNQLYDAIEASHTASPEMKGTSRLQKPEIRELFIHHHAKVHYEDKYIKVIVPFTENASCLLGSGTKWCTAATKTRNEFDYYHSQGNLYIIFTHDGKRYQFWIAERLSPEEAEDAEGYGEDDENSIGNYELNDERNQEVSLDDFFKKYPSVRKAFPRLIGEFPGLMAWASEEQIWAHIRNDSDGTMIPDIPWDKQTREMVQHYVERLQYNSPGRPLMLYFNPKFLTDHQLLWAMTDLRAKYHIGSLPDKFWNKRTADLFLQADPRNLNTGRLDLYSSEQVAKHLRFTPNDIKAIPKKRQTKEMIDGLLLNPEYFMKGYVSDIRDDLLTPELAQVLAEYLEEVAHRAYSGRALPISQRDLNILQRFGIKLNLPHGFTIQEGGLGPYNRDYEGLERSVTTTLTN